MEGVNILRVCSFGSLNLEYVYRVAAAAGEWEIARAQERVVRCGGKGLNQSIALACHGVQVYQAGNIGTVDGQMLLNTLRVNNVDIRFVGQQNSASGQAIVQRDGLGRERRLYFGGANQAISSQQIRDVLGWFSPGDLLVVQNEIPLLSELIRAAKARGMRVALNPSPVQFLPDDLPLDLTDCLLATDAEMCSLTGEISPRNAMQSLAGTYPGMRVVCLCADCAIVLADGIWHEEHFGGAIEHTPEMVDAFIGHYLGRICAGEPDDHCLSIVSAVLERSQRARFDDSARHPDKPRP